MYIGVRVDVALFADDVALWAKLCSGHSGDKDLRNVFGRGLYWGVRWRMTWSGKKSGVVVFSNHRSRPELKCDFRIGDTQLARASSYRYLGVVLHEKLKWAEHFTSVRQKATATSHWLCRIVQDEGPPAFPAVRRLLHAVLLPQIGYAFPWWKPTALQCATINTIIARPLLRVLHLPFSTHRLSLLLECGVPDTQSLWNRSVLRYAAGVSKLPADHPSRNLWEAESAGLQLTLLSRNAGSYHPCPLHQLASDNGFPPVSRSMRIMTEFNSTWL